MTMLPILMPGDAVELIAPASRCSDLQLQELNELLDSWQLHCIVNEDIFAPDLLCANTDVARFRHLNNALQNPHTKAVICVRGGYGSMRLIPSLSTMQPPIKPKLFVGMSDITCLHLYLQQCWGWPTIHGAAMPSKFSAQSIAALKTILFAKSPVTVFSELKPLNFQASTDGVIESTVTGGNLTMVQASIGTNWQLDARGKIILLEEVNERAYRVDRILEHLQQANLFKGAAAILFGDFLESDEPDGSSLIQPVLQRFAQQCDIPVVQIEGIGHGSTNYPIPCATKTHLQLGASIQLTCFR